MIRAARTFSILIVFLVAAASLLRLPRIFEVGPGEQLSTGGHVAAVVIAVVFPLLLCMPLVLALLSLGRERPRLLFAALVTNSLYLLILIGALVSIALVGRGFSQLMLFVPVAAFFVTCFALNVIALWKQRGAV